MGNLFAHENTEKKGALWPGLNVQHVDIPSKPKLRPTNALLASSNARLLIAPVTRLIAGARKTLTRE